MIWMAFTLAATPEELALALPTAQAQLADCIADGCERREGAKAAWMVAVGTYTQTGVADGALAATVRELDAGLFEALPDVIREAASEPQPWSTRVGGTPRPAAVERTWPSEVREPGEDPNLEPLRNPRYLTVEVRTSSGAIVPSATVRIPDEDEAHRVHAETGRWTTSALYLPDGTERVFAKGERVSLIVSAPGFAVTRLEYVLPGKRRNEVVVRLEPKTFEVRDGATRAERVAIESWARWVEADRASLAQPTDPTTREARHQRDETARLAREWMDLGGGEPAFELCLMTGSSRLCGSHAEPDRSE